VGGASSAAIRSSSAQLGHLDVGALPLHVPQKSRGRIPERGARHHIIHLPVLQQKFGGLKSVR
jgi:hypothetical protein